MRYCYAKRLHNGDEVTIKATNETVDVISTQEFIDAAGKPAIQVYVQSPQDGYVGLHHHEIE